MPALMPSAALIGDVGGTNTRFALTTVSGRYSAVTHYANATAVDLEALIGRYLDERHLSPERLQLWLAVAAPVQGDTVEMTNLAWRISASGLRERFGFRHVRLVNDFAAVALSLATLQTGDYLTLGGGSGADGAPCLVLGPGTGLGAALWVPTAGADVVLETEAGHATLSAGDDREAEVIAVARRRHPHVSAERLLCGSGLSEIYQALAEIAGKAGRPPPPEVVTERGIRGADPLAVATLELFFSLLGGFAGNLALSTGARGGVYLAGGILPRLADRIQASPLPARFVAKGRFAAYLEAIPLRLIVHPDPGLLGLAQGAGRDTPAAT